MQLALAEVRIEGMTELKAEAERLYPDDEFRRDHHVSLNKLFIAELEKRKPYEILSKERIQLIQEYNTEKNPDDFGRRLAFFCNEIDSFHWLAGLKPSKAVNAKSLAWLKKKAREQEPKSYTSEMTWLKLEIAAGEELARMVPPVGMSKETLDAIFLNMREKSKLVSVERWSVFLGLLKSDIKDWELVNAAFINGSEDLRNLIRKERLTDPLDFSEHWNKISIWEGRRRMKPSSDPSAEFTKQVEAYISEVESQALKISGVKSAFFKK